VTQWAANLGGKTVGHSRLIKLHQHYMCNAWATHFVSSRSIRIKYKIQVMFIAIMGVNMKNTAGDDGGVASDV
jgi:hypothetical protein